MYPKNIMVDHVCSNLTAISWVSTVFHRIDGIFPEIDPWKNLWESGVEIVTGTFAVISLSK